MILLLLLAALPPAYLAARDNPVPPFICLWNGQVLQPCLPVHPANKKHVRMISLLQAGSHTENGTSINDTTVVYKLWYTPRGEEISLEGASYNEFKGFKNITFNNDGNIVSKTFETFGIRGCGNYHWPVGGTVTYTYQYNDGLCTRVTSGDSSYTSYSYNSRGLKTKMQSWYYYADSGRRTPHATEYSRQYSYDAKGRLAGEFEVNNFGNTNADSIPSLPSSLLQVLLRQAEAYRDTYLLATYQLTEDSLSDSRSDLPAGIVKQIDDQDAADERTIDRYKTMARYFTGYDYDSKGRLAHSYRFDGDDLDQVNTFTYDKKNRLTTWQVLSDYDLHSAHTAAGKTLWQFWYNSRGQVTQCQRQYFSIAKTPGSSHAVSGGVLTCTGTETFSFGYDKDRQVAVVGVNSSDGIDTHYIIRYQYF